MGLYRNLFRIANGDTQNVSVFLGNLVRIPHVAARTGSQGIGQRRHHAKMGLILKHALVVSGVADVEEIAEGMRFVLPGAVGVNWILALHIMAVLA